MEQCREIVADVVSYMEKTGPQSGHLLGIALKKAYQLHHSFVDGMHVGQFVDRLQMYFDLMD